MPRLTVRYERAKLYEEVWANPVTKVARTYSISDVALRKICKKLAVPLPPLGYWARLAAGQKLPTPPLLKYSGPTEILRHRFVSHEHGQPEPEHLVARREFEARPENQIIVSEKLSKPHPLVASTKRALRPRKGRDGRDVPAVEPQSLDIAVGERSVPRALRIMDALAKALDARGTPLHIIEVEGRQRSCVTLHGQELPIRVIETLSQQPPGMMKLGIVGWYHYDLTKVIADGKRQRIEQRLNKFIVGLEAEAVHRKLEAECREREHRLWEEEERRREERREEQEKEAERLKALQEQVSNWRKAEEIRAYVAAVEAKTARENGVIDGGSELGRWIAWARRKADWIDPLFNTKCLLLDEEHDVEEQTDLTDIV